MIINKIKNICVIICDFISIILIPIGLGTILCMDVPPETNYLHRGIYLIIFSFLCVILEGALVYQFFSIIKEMIKEAGKKE